MSLGQTVWCVLWSAALDVFQLPQVQGRMQGPSLPQAQPTPAASQPAATSLKPKRGLSASRKAYNKRKRKAKYALVKQLLAAAKQSGLKPADASAAAAAQNPAATIEPAPEANTAPAQAPAAASGHVSAPQTAAVHPTAKPGESAGVLASGSGGVVVRTAAEKRRAYRRKQNLKKKERLAREAADAQAAGHSLHPRGPPAAGADAPLTTSQRRRQKKRQREAQQAAEDAALAAPFQAPAAAAAAAAAARGSVEIIQDQKRHRTGEPVASTADAMADATADAVQSADPSLVRLSGCYHLCTLAASLSCSLNVLALTES